jgi:hypothetical protein
MGACERRVWLHADAKAAGMRRAGAPWQTRRRSGEVAGHCRWTGKPPPACQQIPSSFPVCVRVGAARDCVRIKGGGEQAAVTPAAAGRARAASARQRAVDRCSSGMQRHVQAKSIHQAPFRPSASSYGPQRPAFSLVAVLLPSFRALPMQSWYCVGYIKLSRSHRRCATHSSSDGRQRLTFLCPLEQMSEANSVH